MRIRKYVLSPNVVLDYKVEFLFKPILFRAGITTIFSEPGLGKSRLVQNIILNLLRRNLVNRVFYIFPDEDYSGSILKVLLTEFPDKFFILSPDSNFRRSLSRDISDSCFGEGDLFIFDSLDSYAEALGIDLFKKTGSLFADFKALKRLGCSVLILHHPNKAGQYAGKVTIKAQSDALFSMQSVGKLKWQLIAEKHRGREVLNGYTDCFVCIEDDELQVITDFIPGDDEYVVKSVLEELSAGDKKQYEIIKALKEKEISKYKVLKVLERYDGRFWISKRGERNSLIYSKAVNIVVEQESEQESETSSLEVSPELEDREPNQKEREILTKLRDYVLSCVEKGRQGSGVREAIDEVARDLSENHLTEEEREKLKVLSGKKRLKKQERRELESIEKKLSDYRNFYSEEVSRVLCSFGSYAGLVVEGEWLKVKFSDDEYDLPIDF